MTNGTTHDDGTAAATATAGEVDTFGIGLPPQWVRFPLDDGRAFDDLVRQQRERLVAEAQLTRTASRRFELLMHTVRADCRRSNVRMVATMTDTFEPDPDDPVLDGDGADGDGSRRELLSAACTIAVLDRREMGSDLPLTVSTMVVALGREPRAQDGAEVTNLEPAAIEQLPAGKAVKLVRLHTFEPPDPTVQRPKMFVQQFLMPIDDGERAAVVSFATPTVEHARALGELFDAMMSTFRVFRGDDPTDPTRPAST
ncbi:MAG: hypothetical protein CL424_03175 [Acidimicrobiaceae bacterium]|nr:hypothetical protein [Acidimicrobiaceae bacterium]